MEHVESIFVVLCHPSGVVCLFLHRCAHSGVEGLWVHAGRSIHGCVAFEYGVIGAAPLLYGVVGFSDKG